MGVRSRTYLRIIGVGVVLFWLFMLGLLAKRNYFLPIEPLPVIASVDDELFYGREWMGIYFKEKKIGYAVSNMKKDDSGINITEKSFMKMNLMGIPRKVQTSLKARVGLDYRLKDFDFSLESGAVRFGVSGKVLGRELKVKLLSGGRVREETIKLKAIPYLSANVRFRLLKEQLKKGDRFRFPFFEPMTMSQKEMFAEVEDKEILRSGTFEREAYRVKLSSGGTHFRMWITPTGEQLRVEAPLGIVFVKEDREEALTKNWSRDGLTDFILSTSVPVKKKIPDPRNISYLKLMAWDIPLSDFAVWNGRQKLQGHEIEVRKETLNGFSASKIPYKGDEMEAYLRPSTLIQSDDERIIEKAGEILKEESDGLRATRKILKWVHGFIWKAPTISIPSAIEVLETRQGDCNEHTALFTALARASGIPTKISVGLVYLEGRFYYHAWAEVFLGKWIAVDPLLNQIPADPTHIKLVEGGLDKQMAMSKVIGKLKIRVLEFR